MFSILMSVYRNDSCEYFSTALDSLFNQTLLPAQIVLVCDGPIPQEHESIISRWSEAFCKKNVIFDLVRLKKNVGLGAALKEGSLYCNHDYIIRMDSDDISVPNRLELTYQAITENPDAAVIGGQIEEFNFIIGDLGRKRLVPLDSVGIAKFGKTRNPMNHVTVCINKEYLNVVGGYESVLYHEDYFLWVKFITSGQKLVNIPDTLVMVRAGNDLIGRRIGSHYFSLEVDFVKKCQSVNYFNRLDSLRYLLPRLFLRHLPKNMLNRFYGSLRS
ncbi:hypothetical protein BBM55_05750 [Vibrio parahaemolyticus]|uniref:glycosyltransferase n=1 Tax=Vibrio harveyi group TaxID=717610 RepID=UPI00084BAB52|nr:MULTISPECIES: glycosyltransferase [Vibrio harveyi group]OEA22304.1 hypothetical protein BBM55_05750 [Vibrio parahaemolyticus]